VWMGQKDALNVGVNVDSFLTLSKGDSAKLIAEIETNGELTAPISKGEKVGNVIYTVEDKEVARADLVALESVEQGSMFKRFMDWIKRTISSWF